MDNTFTQQMSRDRAGLKWLINSIVKDPLKSTFLLMMVSSSGWLHSRWQNGCSQSWVVPYHVKYGSFFPLKYKTNVLSFPQMTPPEITCLSLVVKVMAYPQRLRTGLKPMVQSFSGTIGSIWWYPYIIVLLRSYFWVGAGINLT